MTEILRLIIDIIQLCIIFFLAYQLVQEYENNKWHLRVYISQQEIIESQDKELKKLKGSNEASNPHPS